MKYVKRAFRILCGIFIMAVFLLIMYYFTGQEYLEGNIRHYIGESVVTESHLAELSEHMSIGGVYSSVSMTERIDGGFVSIEYDFFSDEIYTYLRAAPFNYFNTPALYTIVEMDNPIYVLIFMFVFIVLWVVASMGWGKFVLTDRTKRKAMNVMWYMMHPKHIRKRSATVGYYPSQIHSSVNVEMDDLGIVCTRTWKYKDGLLYSSGIGQSRWETKTLLANKTPTDTNENGVYAVRVGHLGIQGFITDILGVVSLKGDWCEHADGVVRAERCDIMHLIVSEYHRPIASNLSAIYGVPVTICNNAVNTYLDWALGLNGIACMKHNYKITGGNNGNNGKGNKKRADKTSDAIANS